MSSQKKLQSRSGRPNRQAGAVLIVSLVVLLIVTMIGVSSMRGSVLEEKMAGNVRDRNVAFQSAESTMREAEDFIEGVVSLGNFTGSGGLYGIANPAPSYWDQTTWTSSGNHVVAGNKYGAYEAPKYYIKHFTTVVGTEGAMNMSGYGDNKGTGDVSIFTITGRATGSSADSAEVILRSQYGRIF